MSRHEVIIGFNTDNLDRATVALRNLTGWKFESHESPSLGKHDVFRKQNVVVRYNFVPSRGTWELPEDQDVGVLVIARSTERPEFFRKLVSRLPFGAKIVRERIIGE